MNFYCDSSGTIFHVDSENVYQGGKNADVFYFIGAFPSSSVVMVAYQLPNGVWTEREICTRVTDISLTEIPAFDTSFNVWYIRLRDVITQYAGVVSVQFYVIGNNGNSTITIPTSTVSFEVLRGIPVEITDPQDTNIVEQILTNLTALTGAVDTNTNNITALETSIGNAEYEIEVLQGKVTSLQDQVGDIIENGVGNGALENVAYTNAENIFTQTQDFDKTINVKEFVNVGYSSTYDGPILQIIGDMFIKPKNGPDDNYLTLPDETGTLATREWVNNQTATTVDAEFFSSLYQ